MAHYESFQKLVEDIIACSDEQRKRSFLYTYKLHASASTLLAIVEYIHKVKVVGSRPASKALRRTESEGPASINAVSTFLDDHAVPSDTASPISSSSSTSSSASASASSSSSSSAKPPGSSANSNTLIAAVAAAALSATGASAEDEQDQPDSKHASVVVVAVTPPRRSRFQPLTILADLPPETVKQLYVPAPATAPSLPPPPLSSAPLSLTSHAHTHTHTRYAVSAPFSVSGS